MKRVSYLVVQQERGEGTEESPLRVVEHWYEEDSLDLHFIYDPYTEELEHFFKETP